jgi:hypothetical protein
MQLFRICLKFVFTFAVMIVETDHKAKTERGRQIKRFKEEKTGGYAVGYKTSWYDNLL